MAEIISTEPALQALDGLVEYIALDNSAAARRLVSEIFAKIERLCSAAINKNITQSKQAL